MGGVGTPKVDMKAVWIQSEKSLVCGIKELDACGALTLPPLYADTQTLTSRSSFVSRTKLGPLDLLAPFLELPSEVLA
jgi:hypothetical protein